MNTGAIAIVDDDPGILRSLDRLLSGRGFVVRTFPSAEAFLSSYGKEPIDCALFDLAMPGLDGLKLQERLRQRGVTLPVVFLTGEGDIPASVRAIKAGAVNFLTKPVDAKELLETLRVALIEGSRTRAAGKELASLRERFDRLTPRELEVLRHVIAGQLNKQIASDLGISEQTVKVHRMHITEKAGLPSVAELVRAAGLLGISSAN